MLIVSLRPDISHRKFVIIMTLCRENSLNPARRASVFVPPRLNASPGSAVFVQGTTAARRTAAPTCPGSDISVRFASSTAPLPPKPFTIKPHLPHLYFRGFS